MSKIPSQDRTLLLVTMVVITVVIDILTGWGGDRKNIKVVHIHIHIKV